MSSLGIVGLGPQLCGYMTLGSMTWYYWITVSTTSLTGCAAVIDAGVPSLLLRVSPAEPRATES